MEIWQCTCSMPWHLCPLHSHWTIHHQCLKHFRNQQRMKGTKRRASSLPQPPRSSPRNARVPHPPKTHNHPTTPAGTYISNGATTASVVNASLQAGDGSSPGGRLPHGFQRHSESAQSTNLRTADSSAVGLIRSPTIKAMRKPSKVGDRINHKRRKIDTSVTDHNA